MSYSTHMDADSGYCKKSQNQHTLHGEKGAGKFLITSAPIPTPIRKRIATIHGRTAMEFPNPVELADKAIVVTATMTSSIPYSLVRPYPVVGVSLFAR